MAKCMVPFLDPASQSQCHFSKMIWKISRQRDEFKMEPAREGFELGSWLGVSFGFIWMWGKMEDLGDHRC
jgi:hypothetical protein